MLQDYGTCETTLNFSAVLNYTGEVIDGTILAKEMDHTLVSFAVSPEIQEMFISFLVMTISCAGSNSSEPVEVGKVQITVPTKLEIN